MNTTRVPRNEVTVHGWELRSRVGVEEDGSLGIDRGRPPRHGATRARRVPGDSTAPSQKVSTLSRFMKAPCPVSVFQQVSPFSSEAHTYFS